MKMVVKGTELLSVSDAAARLGVAPITLRRWLKRRMLAHVRIGRRIVLDVRDLEKFFADRRVEAQEQAP